MRCIAVVLGLIWVSNAFAGMPVEIVNMVERFLTLEESIGDEFWRECPGGYIMRHDEDIDGDGRKELFITMSMWVQKGVTPWQVYKKKRLAGYEPYLWLGMEKEGGAFSTLFVNGNFPPSYGFVKRKPVLRSTWHEKYATDGKYYGVDFHFLYGNTHWVETEDTDSYYETVLQLDKEQKVSFEWIKVILLADFLRNPETPWRIVPGGAIEGLEYCDGLLSEDLHRVAWMKNFTQDVARTWFERAKRGLPIEGDTSPYDSPSAEPIESVLGRANSKAGKYAVKSWEKPPALALACSEEEGAGVKGGEWDAYGMILGGLLLIGGAYFSRRASAAV